VQGAITQPELDYTQRVNVGVVVSKIPKEIFVSAGSKVSFSYFMSVRTDIPGDKRAENEEPYQAAYRELQEALSIHNQNQVDGFGLSPLMQLHISTWKNDFWNQGRIEIHGNLPLAQIVNSSIYWILLSTREDWPFGLSPGSLASNAYNGHSFWDTETWMYPPVLMLHHQLAKSLLQYRFNTLPAAKAKAKSYNHCAPSDLLVYECIIWPPDPRLWASLPDATKQGYQKAANFILSSIDPNYILPISIDNPESSPQGNCEYAGALFAWESGFSGAEVCPCMAGGTCLHEHHISGDIAFAVYQYWMLTKNQTWLETQGYPLVYEIALFWESRG
jgi:trehalose/maltose hydrolase-like predicted phosphorylase